MKFLDVIKRILLYKQNPSWKLNDYFIEAKDPINNQYCPVDGDKTHLFTCIKDYHGFCLYIPTDNIEKIIYNNKKIYNKKFHLLNISEIRRHSTKRNVIGQVYNRTSPTAVKIKLVEYVYILNTTIYLVYVLDLNYNDEIYSDLLNYKNIEGRYE